MAMYEAFSIKLFYFIAYYPQTNGSKKYTNQIAEIVF